MLINHTSKQVTAKIVYYGPGLCGKTTNLQYIFSVTNPNTRGELVSMETEIERTLFFDLLPINVGLLKGYQTKFQLYTVPGQVFYDSTRRLVLKGVDGIVFVADSQELMEPANLESFENLKDNLAFHRQNIEEMPLVFQYNKRDLKNLLPVEKLNEGLNQRRLPYFEAVASTGSGVIETLRDISSLTLVKIKEALERATVSAQSLSVNFDMDASQRIYKLKDLPIKKIGVEEMPAIETVQTAPQKTEPPAAAPAAAEMAVADEDASRQLQMAKSLGSLLTKLEDPSRITKIEKISGANGRLTIDIKGHDGTVLNSFAVELDPGTKKVNIILDVNK
ncbi:MAG: GTPase domain-containing protein [Candidatus Aminicenantes bacterium]|nr:GTPase domain-containing protein [Candidatus Aminicenantes bacterium]